MLELLFRVEDDLNSFCLDFFPTVYRQFGNGQSRLAKENLLLSAADPHELGDRLREQAHISGVGWPAVSREATVPKRRADSDSAPPARPATARRPAPPARCAYDDKWYVPRPDEEAQTLEALEYPGATAALMAPIGFGKTWMMEHVLRQLRSRGRIVTLNLRAFGDEQTMQSFSGFLRELARQILADATELSAAETAATIDEAWRFAMNPIDNLNRLMRRQILPSLSPKWLILALDDVDTLRKHPYLEDFFTLLRSWMEGSCHPPWDALRLFMTLSMPPRLLIANINQSPFNNATKIALGDLDDQQIAQLCDMYDVRWTAEERQAVQAHVGGHPYLLKLALREARRTHRTVAELLSPDCSVFDDHLADRQSWLAARPLLQQVFVGAASGRKQSDFLAIDRLVHEGLLRQAGGTAVVRYAVYRRLLRGLETP